jgi:hypothetical protein
MKGRATFSGSWLRSVVLAPPAIGPEGRGFDFSDHAGKPVGSAPEPAWSAIDAWTAAAGFTEGFVFRPVNRGDEVSGQPLVCRPAPPPLRWGNPSTDMR